jgi:hypothetical protein
MTFSSIVDTMKFSAAISIFIHSLTSSVLAVTAAAFEGFATGANTVGF